MVGKSSNTSAQPAILMIALIGMLSSGLLWWSSEHWLRAFSGHAPITDSIRLSKQAALQAYLFQARRRSGDSSIQPQDIRASLDYARLLADDTLHARSSLVGIRPEHPAQELAMKLTAYKEHLEAFARLVEQSLIRSDAQPELEIRIRNAFHESELKASEIESQQILKLIDAISHQHGVQATLLMIWSGFLLVIALIVMRLSRSEARSKAMLVDTQAELSEIDARMEFLAHHDPLTKLPNRLLFHSRLV
ncbi:MAG: GGDEF domain-containing protein, partial [Pseudomonadota bacterium]